MYLHSFVSLTCVPEEQLLVTSKVHNPINNHALQNITPFLLAFHHFSHDVVGNHALSACLKLYRFKLILVS